MILSHLWAPSAAVQKQLLALQTDALKKEIRSADRSRTRDGTNLEYLKNVVLKYIETEEHETLMPVLSSLLQFTTEEVSRANLARDSRKAPITTTVWGYLGYPTTPTKPS